MYNFNTFTGMMFDTYRIYAHEWSLYFWSFSSAVCLSFLFLLGCAISLLVDGLFVMFVLRFGYHVCYGDNICVCRAITHGIRAIALYVQGISHVEGEFSSTEVPGSICRFYHFRGMATFLGHARARRLNLQLARIVCLFSVSNRLYKFRYRNIP